MNLSRLLIPVVAILACSVTFSACNDSDDNIGSSLLDTDGQIIVEDQFFISGQSQPIGAVQSRTVMQLLGNIDAKGYGSFYSDFITQFMPAAALDTTLTDASQISKVRLVLMYYAGQFVGDSIVPMGLEVYRLNRPLSAPIYSNESPDGYYDRADFLASQSYTAANIELSDSLAALDYREIFVDLPLSLGTELFDIYKQNPDNYLDPYRFCDLFKGLYVKSSFGSGRVTKIGASAIQLLYDYKTTTSEGRDTIKSLTGTFYAVSPEVITNNCIRYTMSDDLQRRIDSGQTLIVAPAGQEVDFSFPIDDIISYYNTHKSRLSVINDLSLFIPATRISNNYGINPPQYLLMILKSKKKEFFEKSQISDGVTSFYAQYNSTTGGYNFGSLRAYMIKMLDEANIDPDDCYFTLTPISVATESVGSSYYGDASTIVTNMAPYVEQPAMVQLNLEDAKIVLTFSKQNIKN